MLKWIRRAALAMAIVLVAAVGNLAIVKARSDARIFDGYDPTAPLDVFIRADEATADYRRIEFVYRGRVDSDDSLVRDVPTILCAPLDSEGPWPTLIFMHGIGQKKDFVEEIAPPFVKAGFAILCSDQYMQGERKLRPDTPVLDQALALRHRAALNVLETRRLLDYLETRPDIAHDRIYLMGASFGAITGSNAAAFDERIAAAVLCYGGGNTAALVDSEVVREEVGAWIGLVKMGATALFGPLDPALHIHRIAPRPILVQGGNFDRVVPAASTMALFEAASDPKELRMYDSDHVGLDEAHVRIVLDDTLEWLQALEAARVATKEPTAGRQAAR